MMATPIDHARAFVQRGWCPVPVAFRSKVPTDPKTGLAMNDWEKLRIGMDELRQWFNGEPQNIGIALGEASGDLVDIDLDCDEAVELGFQFLPRTGAVFGRPGRPRSHWLYRCKTKTRKFQDIDSKMLLEIRSTGAQTVGPGSVHDKTGEPISWEPGRADHPAEISEQKLTWIVQRLACAVILARHFPAEGGRHDAMLHLAGGLLRSGFDVDDAGGFIVAVARAGGSSDPECHRKAAADTAEKIRAGDNATGWPSYARCCPNGEDVVRKVCEWLGVQPDKTEDTTPEAPIELVELYSFIGPALDRAERRRSGEEKPIPIPFTEYAEIIGGGLWPGAHFVVSGTGVGKSQMEIQNAVFAVKQSIPVAYIGLELDAMQIALRALAEQTQMRWSNLYLGTCSADDIVKAREAAQVFQGLPFYPDFGPPRGWPVSRLYKLAEAMRKKHPTGPMLMILDYLQLISADPVEFDRRPDLRELVGNAAYAARELARRYDATVRVISSAARNHYGLLAGEVEHAGLISRQVPGWFEPRRIIAQPSALIGLGKESGEVEFSADSVTVLVRWPVPLESGETVVLCTVPKWRAGQPQWCALRFYARFEEYPCRNLADLPQPEDKPKKGGRPAANDGPLGDAVMATLQKLGPTSKRRLVMATKGNDTKLYRAIKDLVADGLIKVANDGTLSAANAAEKPEGEQQ